MKRKKMTSKKSKKLFSRTAGNQHVHPKNAIGSGAGPMRGGIRL